MTFKNFALSLLALFLCAGTMAARVPAAAADGATNRPAIDRSAIGRSAIDRPECIAPAKPGGGFDLTCRVAQEALKKALGRPLEVSFMPGGIGAVAINLFNSTRTDDPNAIVAFSSGSLLNMVEGKYGQWGENDVRFLATVGADYGAVVVRADSPYKTLDALMKALEAHPQGTVIGAGGSVGSQDWMKGALLFKTINVAPQKMRYVAFDGGGDAMAGLLGGSIAVYLGDVGEMTSYITSNKIRMLAVLSDERLQAPFADIPTAREEGYDAQWPILRGFYMGKNVSDEVYSLWVEAFRKAYKDPFFAKVQKEKGLLPLNLAGADLRNSITERVARMRAVAKQAGLIR